MCGIVGGIAQREVAPVLLEGLRRLEYRGYDSAGMAVLNDAGELERLRTTGKVAELARAIDRQPLKGVAGIAHTRWATHGRPSESNAHPHICRNRVAVVHNGIVENHARLRDQQKELEFAFTSETDTEVIAHQIYHHLDRGNSLLQAVQRACGELEGAYALGVVSTCEPGRLIAVRRGSPLVIGLGIGEYFIASDMAALLPVTRRFVVLHDGDLVDLTRDAVVIYDARGDRVERPETHSRLSVDNVERGAAFAREKEVDLIIGLGGGSSLDCAKGINFLLTNGGRMQDYWGYGKATKPIKVTVPVAGRPTEIDITDEELKSAYEADKTSYMLPEQRRIEQIAFENKAAAEKALAEIRQGSPGGGQGAEVAFGDGPQAVAGSHGPSGRFGDDFGAGCRESVVYRFEVAQQAPPETVELRPVGGVADPEEPDAKRILCHGPRLSPR